MLMFYKWGVKRYMIGIIGVMEEEVMILKCKLNDMNEINIVYVKFYVGKLNYKEVVLI